MSLTPRQRELARHALGFPNKKNESYRNRFCAGPGHADYEEWFQMAKDGYAIEQKDPTLWGGDSMFYLTLKGALEARNPKEHISREDAAMMHRIEAIPDISTDELHRELGGKS